MRARLAGVNPNSQACFIISLLATLAIVSNGFLIMLPVEEDLTNRPWLTGSSFAILAINFSAASQRPNAWQ